MSAAAVTLATQGRAMAAAFASTQAAFRRAGEAFSRMFQQVRRADPEYVAALIALDRAVLDTRAILSPTAIRDAADMDALLAEVRAQVRDGVAW